MAGEDKHWAQRYLIDPLTAPDPSDETGPGASLTPPKTHNTGTSKLSSNTTGNSKIGSNTTGGSSSNPFRRGTDSSPKQKGGFRVRSSSLKSTASTMTTAIGSGYPSGLPPSYKEAEFGADSSHPWQRQSSDGNRPATSNGVAGHMRRHSSLKERFPGDKSLHPLDEIKRENRRANRAPHLRKRHQPGRDSIDRLDDIGLSYHHEGPYDAALFTRNSSYKSSPIAAVTNGNQAALKATPQDKINDSLDRHMPLDGVAAFPPGEQDPLGRTYMYEEGENINIIGAGVDAYARWPGVTYRDDDHKGKGEPGWDGTPVIQNYKKEVKGRPAVMELTDSPNSRHTRSASADSSGHVMAGGPQSYAEWEHARKPHHFGEGIKKRLGSLRRHQQQQA